MSGTGRIQLVREGDRGALRALFSEHIQGVYAHAKELTGEETTAKAALKKTLVEAQEKCAQCPEDALPWLCFLCDTVLGVMPMPEEAAGEVTEQSVPAAEAAPGEKNSRTAVSVEMPVPDCEKVGENPPEPVEEQVEYPQPEAKASVEETVQEIQCEPENEPEPVVEEDSAPVCCMRGMEIPAPKYDMAQDEWLIKLRQEKRRMIQQVENSCRQDVEITENKPEPVENSVETEDFFPEKKPKKRGFDRICIILLVIVILLLLWVLAGQLMNMDILPFKDLGYNWFNTHIMNMF